MLKTITVNIANVRESDRLEPNYWVIANFVDSVLKLHKHRKLADYSRFVKKGIFDLRAARYKENGVPFLRISNIKYFELNTEDLVYISNEDNMANRSTILRHGDIAFSKIGTLGKLLRIGKRYPEVNISQNLIGVGLKSDVNKNYIFAYLLSKLSLLQIKKNKKRQLQDKLNLADIRDIAVVEIPEDKVKLIDGLVEEAELKAEKAVAVLSQAQEYFFQRATVDFSKIQRPKYYSVMLSSFKDADIWNSNYSYPFYINTLQAIQRKWKTVRLGEITTAKKGDEVGSDNYNTYLGKKDTDIPFIRTSDLVNYEVDQFPDFYIPEEIYRELKQDIKAGDIVYSNDGKIGLVAMLTAEDKVILQSHIKRLRLNKEAMEKYHFTQEHLFLLLTIKEVARYQAERYTVIQSTIPTISKHIRDFEIPILDQDTVDEITKLVKEAFILKDQKKLLIKRVREEIDNYLGI